MTLKPKFMKFFLSGIEMVVILHWCFGGCCTLCQCSYCRTKTFGKNGDIRMVWYNLALQSILIVLVFWGWDQPFRSKSYLCLLSFHHQSLQLGKFLVFNAWLHFCVYFQYITSWNELKYLNSIFKQGRIQGWTVACCWAEAVIQINELFGLKSTEKAIKNEVITDRPTVRQSEL